MFVGVVIGGVALFAAPKHHQDEYYRDNEDLFQPAVLYSVDWNAVSEDAGFVSPWWPSHGYLMGGSGDGLVSDNLLSLTAEYADMWRSFGANGRLAYVGVTRDRYGSPLGNCTVRCFRTSTDELVSKVTSDANGAYIATTPYADGHYLVVHGSSGPELAGASVSTLLPA
jgi:hypothetical protein